MKRAVVLVSGGMDSAVTLALAREQGFACHALSVDYGQRHVSELTAAQNVARALGAVEHKTVHVDLRSIGGSALTADIDVPVDSPLGGGGVDIPVTYVPARNTIMLSVALGWAEVSAHRTSSVVSMRSIIPDIRIAGRNSSPRSRHSRTSPPRPLSKALHCACTHR